MGAGTGAGTETRAVAEMRTGMKMGTGTRTRIGSTRSGTFIPHASLSTGTEKLHSQGPVPAHAHRTKGVTGSKRRKEANGVGGESGVGGGNGDGNEFVCRNGGLNGDGDKDGAGTGTGVVVNE